MRKVIQWAVTLTKTLRTGKHVLLCRELRRVRKDAGLTQAQLANAISKPQSYIAKIETQERRLDVVEFVLWLSACDALLEGAGILDKINVLDQP